MGMQVYFVLALKILWVCKRFSSFFKKATDNLCPLYFHKLTAIAYTPGIPLLSNIKSSPDQSSFPTGRSIFPLFTFTFF